ncbi:RimK family alpha-L-glutamate ligase [Candidatus Woesearchaeota archaeon]|nr:RimK family alpha-L-glutamate ligase [Candidatus Woesearchaeota archaeon]
MVKAAIISLGSVSSKWTYEAMKKYFDEVEEIQLKDIEINISGKKAEILYKGNPLDEYDCIMPKGSFRYAQILRSLTTILEGKCYMPIDPKAFTIAHDKLLTQLMLQQHSIPMPRTYISSTIEAAKELLGTMNYPIIMKFPQGTQGKGVMFADSYASAVTILDAVSSLNQSLIVQEYIETESTDIRAFVIGEKVVASMTRKGNTNEKRSNTHQGGMVEQIALDEQTKEIAVRAAKATGAEICGVDILESIRGPLVIETNISPGLQGITKATKVDIADLIAKYLYKKTVEFLETKDGKNKQNVMTEIDNEGSIITGLDYRGTRILLPEVVSKAARLGSEDQVEIRIKKGKIVIDKFEVN